MSDDKQPNWRDLFDGAMKIAVPILLAAVTWAGATILDHETRLITIENSRFTAANAREILKATETSLAETQRQLAEVKAAAEKANTAQLVAIDGLRDSVSEQRAEVKTNSALLERVEHRLDRVLEDREPR